MKEKVLTSKGLITYDEEIKAFIRESVGTGGQGSSDGYERFNKSITWNENETVYTETWIEGGKSYQKVVTQVSDTVTTTQLVIDNVNSGLWTTTLNEANRTVSTVYTAQ